MINYFQENEYKLDIQRSSSFLFSEDFQFNFEKSDTLFKNDEYVNKYQIDYFDKSQQMLSKDAFDDTNLDSSQKISTFQQSVYRYVKSQQTDEQIVKNLEQTNHVSNNQRDEQKEILASYENNEELRD
ncbi:hypothetical protein PPERSA_06326 [Pseudocohnilembus persalinus]|uniref:Uncharacterized protein n=1 Tax=Pseudocohnilembus persalinus TaxID=266149 RepID=A0A0V0QIJ3_PSEPJ|nr:hypothetical protein PPERSA_06326 [Pseudocohnilembus persalinus]|eukprot:KRX02131.1 hypothetical protein PPERSA_06326 [Pseudocohnilembus persalinus]